MPLRTIATGQENHYHFPITKEKVGDFLNSNKVKVQTSFWPRGTDYTTLNDHKNFLERN